MSQHQLKTLLEIKDNPSLSQRSLSRKLNISLGLTNEILRNLIHRGWIKVNKLNGKKWLYIITPAGMTKAAQFAYRRFQETQKNFWDTENIIINLLDEMYQEGKTKLIILGTGKYAKLIFLASADSPLKLIMFLSSEQSGKNFLGYNLMAIDNFVKEISLHPEELKDTIIISTDQWEEEMLLEKISHTENSDMLRTVDIINISNLIKKYISKVNLTFVNQDIS